VDGAWDGGILELVSDMFTIDCAMPIVSG
jgi:hypothetical protein